MTGAAGKGAILLGVMAVRLDDLGPLKPILGQRPFGLASDIDGTFSPIADTPDLATVTPLCRRYLAEIARQVEVVAAISGPQIMNEADYWLMACLGWSGSSAR
ncbi:MAG: hypothetical protein ACUVV3_02250 [Dehalococcoidia bacterium]